ncbi:hypothetical protein [Neobacillus vireti]|uniref:Spore coat protein D n=1 Tax=Neobacillus vireti LMG 21834 TaxID=1131730 RepID=A0AB94INY3_9BACI|nr:hypothetical protein [Neobacillus vireti]ETI68845.1 hypothetical protein BAVI_10717 [Neobacillus vireti LMG 21834]KLT20003.1 spore coat protein D [Neobacillus vireti]
MFNRSRPITRPPKYVFHNESIRREIPIIQPVVHVNRLDVFDVPRVIYKPIRERVVVEHRHPFHRW